MLTSSTFLYTFACFSFAFLSIMWITSKRCFYNNFSSLNITFFDRGVITKTFQLFPFCYRTCHINKVKFSIIEWDTLMIGFQFIVWKCVPSFHYCYSAKTLSNWNIWDTFSLRNCIFLGLGFSYSNTKLDFPHFWSSKSLKLILDQTLHILYPQSIPKFIKVNKVKFYGQRVVSKCKTL